MDRINKRRDSYQIFMDYVRDKQTRRRYRNLAYRFLELIPDKIYSDILGNIPPDRDVETLCRFFVELAKKDPDTAYDVIAAYIEEDKNQVAGVIIGARLGISNHREDNAKVFDVNLDTNDHSELDKVLSKSNDLFEIIGDCGDEYRH